MEHFIRATEDDNADAVVITYGQIAEQALTARSIAADKGLHIRVIALEKLCPNAAMLQALLALIPTRSKTVFLEEGVQNGGAGMKYASLLAEHGICCKVLAIEDPSLSFRVDESPYKTMGISGVDILTALDI